MPILTDGKIAGLVTPTQYVKVLYYLLLISSGCGVLGGVLALVHVYVPFSGISMLTGLLALIKVVLGLTFLKEVFSSLDYGHFVYVGILFLIFFFFALLLGAMGGMTIGMLIGLVLNIAELVLFWTGFNSWSHGRTISASNLQGEVQAAIKRG